MGCVDGSEGAQIPKQKNSPAFFGANYDKRQKAHLTQFYLDHGFQIPCSRLITNILKDPPVATMATQSEILVDTTEVESQDVIITDPREYKCVLFCCPFRIWSTYNFTDLIWS